MSKVADFLKDFFNFFYRVRVRSEKIDRLLDNHEESLSAIKDIKQNIETLQNRIDGIQTQINDIIPHLDAIKHGTKMELFETLHNWFVLLVVKRGWASPEEKKEVEEQITGTKDVQLLSIYLISSILNSFLPLLHLERLFLWQNQVLVLKRIMVKSFLFFL